MSLKRTMSPIEKDDEKSVDDRMHEIEVDILCMVKKLQDSCKQSGFEVSAIPQDKPFPWLQAMVFTFLLRFKHFSWLDWAYSNAVYDTLDNIKEAFLEYFKLGGLSKQTLEFMERPFFYRSGGEDNIQGQSTLYPSKAKITFVDGFIMEGKSQYVTNIMFCQKKNFFMENDFIYRDEFTTGSHKGTCMLDKLHLMPALHLVSSKILPYTGYDSKLDTIIDRSPLSCVIFDSAQINYALLDFTIWNHALNKYDVVNDRNAPELTIHFMVNQKVVIPDARRAFEMRYYMGPQDLLKKSFAYYFLFTSLLDLLSSPQLQQTVQYCGKFNNRGFKCFNSVFDYFSFIMPGFDEQVITPKATLDYATKIDWIKSLIKYDQVFFLNNERFKLLDSALDIGVLEGVFQSIFSENEDDEKYLSYFDILKTRPRYIQSKPFDASLL